jgi:hypothetical protein
MHNCNETEQKMAALTQAHEIRLIWCGFVTYLLVKTPDRLTSPCAIIASVKAILRVKSTICSITRHFKLAAEFMCFVCVHRKHQLLSYTALVDCIL